MSEKKEESLYWRRLDNSAKIFPISAGKKYSTVFRLSVLLKEKVNKEILEKAVIQTLNNYNMFRVFCFFSNHYSIFYISKWVYIFGISQIFNRRNKRIGTCCY